MYRYLFTTPKIMENLAYRQLSVDLKPYIKSIERLAEEGIFSRYVIRTTAPLPEPIVIEFRLDKVRTKHMVHTSDKI